MLFVGILGPRSCAEAVWRGASGGFNVDVKSAGKEPGMTRRLELEPVAQIMQQLRAHRLNLARSDGGIGWGAVAVSSEGDAAEASS